MIISTYNKGLMILMYNVRVLTDTDTLTASGSFLDTHRFVSCAKAIRSYYCPVLHVHSDLFVNMY